MTSPTATPTAGFPSATLAPSVTSHPTGVPVPISLPQRFSQSWLRWATYPKNLIPRTVGMYPLALEAYRARLALAAPDLFTQDNDKVDVCFRDLEVDGIGPLAKLNVHSEARLKTWLGITETQDPANPQRTIVSATKKDPKSRLIYIYGAHSRDPLRIQLPILAQILSFHQVMPDYLDFMTSFGLQSTARDVRFSGFRQQVTLKQSSAAVAIDQLGRSGKQYQLAYNLKGITLTRADPDNIDKARWAIRNAAIHHQYDVSTHRAVWIVTKGQMDLYERYKELTGPDARSDDKGFGTAEECFTSSLSPHLLFCRWATEDWNAYIKWLEEVLDKLSSMVVLGPRGKSYTSKAYRPSDIRRMQLWEETVSEAIVVLEGNVEVMSSLRQLYLNLKSNTDFPLRDSCAGEIADFTNQLDAMISDFKVSIGRAKALTKTTSDRKELIKQYRGDDAADRVARLNQNMENEAIVVRIITIVTLIYLPATFVSTFFSTDVVKYQGDPDYPDGKFSSTAMNRWLQATLPLTFLTLLGAYLGKSWAERKARAQWVNGETDEKAALAHHAQVNGLQLHGPGPGVMGRSIPLQPYAATNNMRQSPPGP